MIATITILMTIAIKAYYDNRNWGNVHHVTGLMLAAIPIILACLFAGGVWPLFLFSFAWNPTINIIRRLPFFYMGKTAWVDKKLNAFFGDQAGVVWMTGNLLLLIVSIIYHEEITRFIF